MMKQERETPVRDKEPIVVIDNNNPDEVMFASVREIHKDTRLGLEGKIEEGKKVFVQSLEGKTFEFSTLIRLGPGRFTSRDNTYNFYRAQALDPNDPKDKEIICKAIKALPRILNVSTKST